MEHSTSGKRWKERPLFNLETKRERRTVLTVFKFLGVGEQKEESDSSRGAEGQHQRHLPEAKGAPSSPGGCLTQEERAREAMESPLLWIFPALLDKTWSSLMQLAFL